MKKTKVLFLCTGNTARSQMAEALTRKYAGDYIEAYSAGLEPGILNPYAKAVLEEIGIDTSEQYAKGVDTYLGKAHFEYLITVCARAEERCPTTFPGVSHRYSWPFDDPVAFEGNHEQKLQKFREIRDQIDTQVRNWVTEYKTTQLHR